MWDLARIGQAMQVAQAWREDGEPVVLLRAGDAILELTVEGAEALSRGLAEAAQRHRRHATGGLS